MSLTRLAKARRAEKRGDMKKATKLRDDDEFVKKQPGPFDGCERCPEHSVAACFGDNCAKKCCGPNDSEYKPTQVVPESPNMTRGGRKTRRKRRKKRRKSRKNRKKTKRRKKRRRKKSKKVRRK